MDYITEITSIGPEVELLLQEGGLLIVFNLDAPESLSEIAVLHTKVEMTSNVKPGDVVILGKNDYIVTAVGEEANHTLKSMGHCSFKFTGREEVELPGQIELQGSGFPKLAEGDEFTIYFT